MSRTRVLSAAFVALVAALLTAATAGAKTYEVNKRSDHAPNGCKKKDCTLREAVLAANNHAGKDKIALPERKTYNLSIENADPNEDAAATGDLDVTQSLTVSHRGKGRAKVDANGIDRVFELLPGGSTTFKKLVIRGGNDAVDDEDGGGGGIQALDANVTLRRSSVSRNNADENYGGGIELNDEAGLSMSRSSLSNNHSDSDSGALEAGGGPVVIKRSKVNGNTADGSAALYLDTDETVRIEQSTIAGNHSDGPGAIGAYAPTTTIENSTIANNVSEGGAGGGIEAQDDVRITNSTIAGNTSDEDGGGIFVADSNDSLVMNATTVVRNASGDDGGGIFTDSDEPVEIQNSLIALNSAADAGQDCATGTGDGAIDSLGHNLLSETGVFCEGFDATGDLVNSNPKLGKLKNNGGPTQTVALKKGSPAINKAASSAPNKDQRGEKRGKKPDIGAYERVKKKKRR